MTRVSFTLPDVGLREIKGMAFVQDGALVLHIEDSLLGMVDTTRSVVRIEPDALLDVSMKRGWFRDRLVIEPKRAEVLDAVPGNHRVALELRVWRTQRPDLERLVEECERLLWV